MKDSSSLKTHNLESGVDSCFPSLISVLDDLEIIQRVGEKIGSGLGLGLG